MSLLVRDAGPADAEALGELFLLSVREGAAPRYTASERAAWMPAQPTGAAWADRLAKLDVVLAEEQEKKLGFMSLGADGYVDLAFVHPDARGTGVADALYAVLHSRALAANIPRLTTHASLMARSFFARHGWEVEKAETVSRGQEKLKRFEMQKYLSVETEPCQPL